MSEKLIQESNQPANGKYTTNGTPHDFSSLTPFIAVSDASSALNFYQEVFGAQLIDSTIVDGEVVHAELQFSNGRLQVGAAQPQYHVTAPDPSADDVHYSLGLYCPNVDEVVELAVSRGAVLREPLTSFVTGDRFASIRDPFGVRWSVMTRVEDLSAEESAARVREWAQSMSAADATESNS